MTPEHLRPTRLSTILAGRPDDWDLAELDADGWEELVELASAQGVAPLLAWTLHQMGWPEAVPDAVRTRLKATWRASAVRTMLMSHHLLEVIETLSRPPAIPVVLLKGAALGHTLYPESSLRPMCDVDLLVPNDRLDDAVGRFRREGWQGEGLGMVPGCHEILLRDGRVPWFALELHWTLVGGLGGGHGLDIGWFWDQVEPFDLGLLVGADRSMSVSRGMPVFVLNPTAHLLYLAAHLMLQHGAAHASLRWLYDVHLMVELEGKRIDWEKLVRQASELHWATALAATLESAREFFGTRCPEGLLQELARADDGRMTWLVRRGAAPLQSRATSVFARAASLSPLAAIRFMRAVALPSPAYIRWRYHPNPPWLWPLCYPYRWADMAWEAATTLWRLAGEHGSTGAGERRSRGAEEQGSGGAGGERETK